MNFPRTCVVGVDVGSTDASYLESLRKMDFLKFSDIHLVHAVKEYFTGYDVLLGPQAFIEEDKGLIEDSVTKRLKEMSEFILPYDFKGKVHFHCVFGYSPKDAFVEQVKKIKPELTIVLTRENHGFLEDSFAYHCGLHADSDVLMIRNTRHDRFKGPFRVMSAIKVDEQSLASFSLKPYSFMTNAHITLMHVSPLGRFSIGMQADHDRQLVIKEAVTSRLSKMLNAILPQDFRGHCEIDCQFSPNFKKQFAEKIKQSETDYIVIQQQKKTFGSFLHYQLMQTDANILVLRR